RANEATALTLGSSSTATRQRASMESRCLFKCAAIRAYSECESGAIDSFRCDVQGGAICTTVRQTVRQASLGLSAGESRQRGNLAAAALGRDSSAGPALPHAVPKPHNRDQQRDQIRDRESPPDAGQPERGMQRKE